MDIFQLIANMIAQNLGSMGNGGWVNPGFGNIPSHPYQFPVYRQNYQSGFGAPAGDVMGGPSRLPVNTGGPNMAGTTPQTNPMLRDYLSSQNPQLAMRPPIDYRNGRREFGGNRGNGFVRGIFAR